MDVARGGGGADRKRGPQTGSPRRTRDRVADQTIVPAVAIAEPSRRTAFGETEAGLAAARLFVPKGTLAFRQARGQEKEPIDSASGDGTIAQPIVILTDHGTSGAAELFASALWGNKRATLVGERTLGRAAQQKLVKLPDGSGLLLTHLFYLAPGGGAIHEKGLTPDVAVESPDVEFGQPPAETDPVLEKAIESFSEKKAA